MNCKERFYFTSTGLPDVHFHVIRFTGTEKLNQGYYFRINLVSDKVSIKAVSLVAQSCIFSIVRENGEKVIYSGHCKSVLNEGAAPGGYSYITVEFVPKFNALDYIIESKIFLDKNLPNLIEEVLRTSQYVNFDHEIRFSKKYPVQDFSMQYNESAYNFLRYKLEEQGAYFFFNETGDKIIFADSPQAHNKSVGEFRYVPVNGLRQEEQEEIVTSFLGSLHAIPGKVVVRNYDWKDPNRMIVSNVETISEASAITTAVLNDEAVSSQEEADRIAGIRAEQYISQRYVGEGTSFTPYLHAGMIITIAEHPNELFNRDIMITEITHEGNQEAFIALALGVPLETRDQYFYQNTFSCVLAELPFHPKRETARTVISGMINAFIDGDNTNAPVLDEYGRYKVLFPFDLSGRSGGRASCWIRRMQEQVGKDSGMTFPLLPGTEVSISFINGNPDRPVIIGALPNGETGSLSGNANNNFSGIRTPGGAQLTFDNNHNAISLGNRTGSGIRFGSGSLDYLETNTHLGLNCASIGTTDFSGLFKDNISGFSSSDSVSSEFKIGEIFGTLGLQLLDSTSSILSSISSDSSGAKKNALEWGSKTTKLLSTVISCGLKAFKSINNTPYNVRITAERNEVKKEYQSFPTKKEFKGQLIFWLIATFADLSVKAADTAKTQAAETDEKNTDAYKICLKEALQLVYDADRLPDKLELNKYNGDISKAPIGEYFQKSDTSPCAYYSDAYTGLEQSMQSLKTTIAEQDEIIEDENRTEKDKKDAEKKKSSAEILLNQLDVKAGELTTKYNDSCEGKIKKSEFDVYTKQESWRNLVFNNLVDLLPEIALFYTVSKRMAHATGNNVGGMLIDSKDKNINIHAKTYIGQHSERGIFLNTVESMDADWGSPRKKELTGAITDLDPKIEKVFQNIETLTIPVSRSAASVANGTQTDPFTIKEYITPGHVNALSGDPGDGIADLDNSIKKNSFITAKTNLLYADNDLAIHNTKLFFKVQSALINMAAEDLSNTSKPKRAVFDLKNDGTAILKTDGDNAKISLKSTTGVSPLVNQGLVISPKSISLGIPPEQNAEYIHGIGITENSITLVPQNTGGAVLIMKENRAVLANSKSYIDLGGSSGGDEVNIKAKKATIARLIIEDNQIKSTQSGVTIFGAGKEIKITSQSGANDLAASTHADDLKNIAANFPDVTASGSSSASSGSAGSGAGHP